MERLLRLFLKISLDVFGKFVQILKCFVQKNGGSWLLTNLSIYFVLYKIKFLCLLLYYSVYGLKLYQIVVGEKVIDVHHFI